MNITLSSMGTDSLSKKEELYASCILFLQEVDSRKKKKKNEA